jgi:Domain of unknown function (DUF222)
VVEVVGIGGDRRPGATRTAAPRPGTDTDLDLRTAAQRDTDALVDLAHRSLSAGDRPTEGGERPQVVVTMSLGVLQDRIGAASMAFGGPINADLARRIAGDARVIPVVLGSRGEPLDVGRASYTVPTAIRRAVSVRDCGCAFPGVPYRPVGVKSIILSTGPTTVPPASGTAWHCSVGTTNSPTTPTGAST